MTKSSIIFAAALAATLVLAACGDDGEDDASDSTGGVSGAGCTPDTYANYGEAFFKTNCTVCHGAAAATTGDGVRLDSLAGVKEHKTHIIEHAVDLKAPIMPMTGALPAADRERLKKWLNCGSP